MKASVKKQSHQTDTGKKKSLKAGFEKVQKQIDCRKELQRQRAAKLKALNHKKCFPFFILLLRHVLNAAFLCSTRLLF